MAFCLIPSETEKLKKAFREGVIDPVKLAGMESAARRELLGKFVGPENAKEVNALFESKLLLKNQKAGMINWAKKVIGITPKVRQDMISKIERLDSVLDPKEGELFLQDLAETRLGIGITQEEAKQVSDLTKKMADLRSKADENGKFPSEEARLAYGASQVDLENYVNDLKLKSKKISLREKPLKAIGKGISEIPGALKSAVASLDNSFFGRQGIKVLYTNPTMWTKAFIKSWGDIGKVLKGREAIDAVKADIYSRPNALNGKYKAGGYGLDALTEEAYPSSLPERIYVFGRLFKASEQAYNGAALRLRSDLADKYIALAEKSGINTLNKEEAQGLGHLIGSLTGRGSIGKAEVISKELNVIAFSVKFLKSNFDSLTAHMFDPKATKFVKKEAAKNLLRIVGLVASILAITKMLAPDRVEEDSRGSNFGKVKIFGHWTDITGGMGSLVTLASRLVPTKHDGKWSFWSKSGAGQYSDLLEGKFGQQNALDVLDNFLQGKLSPIAGVLRDIWKGKTFSGKPVTPGGEVGQVITPISIGNYSSLKNDPSTSFLIGSMILDGLGFSVSTAPIPNIKSGMIPEGKPISNSSLIDTVLLYANAIGSDPETAFNRMFTGQKIRRVDNGTIIVERMPVGESQAAKKKAGANNPTMKLDHTIPLELGGSNDPSNLKVVTTSQWSSYTKVENALGKALKSGKISKKEAQSLIVDFKNGKVKADSILEKYK